MNMQQYDQASQINQLVDQAKSILIIQADNPDGDSLGSSIALEQIMMLKGKDTEMVCGIKLPSYLSYIPGWDRVTQDIPAKFDLAFIVDSSSQSLIENTTRALLPRSSTHQHPIILIDHHGTPPTIDYASVNLIVPDAAATAEVIYVLAKQLNWELNPAARDALSVAILSDTLGLTTDNTSAQTVLVIAELVEQGVSLSALEHTRRSQLHKSPELVHYKGQLLERINYYDNDRIAILVIPWSEIERYSPFYNPSMLALEDMRLTTGTKVVIAIKVYKDGKVTGKVRSNFGAPVAAKLAEHFGGGGHEYASGFKLSDQSDVDSLVRTIVSKASELLDNNQK